MMRNGQTQAHIGCSSTLCAGMLMKLHIGPVLTDDVVYQHRHVEFNCFNVLTP